MNILVSIQNEVTAWQIPAAQVEYLRRTFPHHRFHHATTVEARTAALPEAEIAFTWLLSPAEIDLAPKLRWVHSSAVAAGTLSLPALAARGIAVSNTRGVQATPIAEHVLACLLALTRRLPLALERQRTQTWSQNEFTGASLPVTLKGQTLGVIGLGSIGAEVARLGAAFGMHVVGVRRDAGRSSPGVATIRGPEGLDDLLACADAVVLAAPFTTSTARLLDRARLARMKPGARLVNVARGQLVDGVALAEALQSGRLAGAALDVFDEEPLPADHPLWRAPNVLITPHTSGFRPGHWDDAIAVFVDNLRRWDAGEPLRWQVDPGRGY